jgi:hypothetical protein
MAMLEKGDIVYRIQGEESRIPVAKGVVNVSHNVIDVCVE